MKAIAAAIEALRAKGMDNGDILDVVQHMLAAESVSVLSGGIPVDKTAERRRAYDRQRKAEKRNSTGQSGHSGGQVPSKQSTGLPPDSTGLPPESAISPISIREEDKKERKKERRGTRLPPDWVPSDALVSYGASLGLTGRQFDREVEKFRNYWLAKAGERGVKLDWDATFRNWLLSAAERLPVPSQPVVATTHRTSNAIWVAKGSAAWVAWTKHRGKEPVTSMNGGVEGQWMPSEYPPTENAA